MTCRPPWRESAGAGWRAATGLARDWRGRRLRDPASGGTAWASSRAGVSTRAWRTPAAPPGRAPGATGGACVLRRRRGDGVAALVDRTDQKNSPGPRYRAGGWSCSGGGDGRAPARCRDWLEGSPVVPRVGRHGHDDFVGASLNVSLASRRPAGPEGVAARLGSVLRYDSGPLGPVLPRSCAAAAPSGRGSVGMRRRQGCGSVSGCGSVRVWRHQGAGPSGCGSVRVWVRQSVAPSGCGSVKVWRRQGVAPSGCGPVKVWLVGVRRRQGVRASGCGSARVRVHQGLARSGCGSVSGCGPVRVWRHQGVGPPECGSVGMRRRQGLGLSGCGSARVRARQGVARRGAARRGAAASGCGGVRVCGRQGAGPSGCGSARVRVRQGAGPSRFG